MLVDENFKQRLRRLFSVMIPILITQTAIMAMNFFDSSMSGHAGAVDLAGTSIGGNIWMPIFVGTNGVLLGSMPIVAHLLGADKRDNIGKVIRHTIFLAIAFSAVIILMGVLFLDTLLTHLYLEPQVLNIETKSKLISSWKAHLLASTGSNMDSKNDRGKFRKGLGLTTNFFSEKFLLTSNVFHNNINRKSNNIKNVLSISDPGSTYNETTYADLATERSWDTENGTYGTFRAFYTFE